VERVFISALAVAMAMFAAPLFFDLSLCMAGNLFRPHRPKPSLRPGIRLAAAIPAHDEPGMIAPAVRSIHASDAQTDVFVVARNSAGAPAKETADAGAHVVELSNCKLRGKSAALRLEQGADAVQCCYELELPTAGAGHPLARLRALAFRGMNVLRQRGRAGPGLPTGEFGNGSAFTAETLERVPFSVNSIAEDAEYHARLVASGIAVPWNDEAFVHAHSPASAKAQATQEARREGGRLCVASRATGQLLLALLRGKGQAFETLTDVWSPPLSRGMPALVLMAFVSVPWLHVFALACVAVALLYVTQTALLSDEPWRDAPHWPARRFTLYDVPSA
jgi:hypothetical protein